MLFEKQYILTETVVTEVRYRTVTRTDSEGNEYEVEVPYNYYICTVELENFDLSHKPTYLPDGAELQNTVELPEFYGYEYAIDDTAYFSIWLSQSDIRIYIDAENADVEPFDKDGITGYFFKKVDLNYVCFERDGCSFSIYGLLDTDELIKIAAGITKE